MMGRQSGQISMLVLDIEELIPENHLLRRINQLVSFNFIYDLAAPYYSANGRPSVDPVSMFKMLLVGYLYGIKSERRLVQEVQLNIAYRWFCGFELGEKIPDHSTFSKTRVRKWNESDFFQKAFLEIVRRCIEQKLIDGKEMASDGSYIPAEVSRNSWIDVEVEVEQSKLSGWAAYHRSTDAYMIFRHIDAVVEGLLVLKMCQKYSHWHRKTVLQKFWITSEGYHIFAVPDDPTCRVVRLAPLATVQHKPCKVSFNPYLDKDYFALIQHRRDVQKANGKYRAVWQRQGGRCAFCGNPMLADQEVEVVEKVIGKGRRVQNLIYIHRQCAYDMFSDSSDYTGDHIDLFDLLGDFVEDAPLRKSPYLELREFFRMSSKSPLSLTFQQIEQILGDYLPAEAYFYDAFWYETMPGMLSPMWQEEGYPLHAIIPDEIDYRDHVSGKSG